MSLFYPQNGTSPFCPRRVQSVLSGRSSDSRIILFREISRKDSQRNLPRLPILSSHSNSGNVAALVPDHSGGPVPFITVFPIKPCNVRRLSLYSLSKGCRKSTIMFAAILNTEILSPGLQQDRSCCFFFV